MNKKIPFDLVLLAGGVGTRMGCATPKQYLTVGRKPLALYSFEVLAAMPGVQNFIIVCEPQYDSLFENYARENKVRLQFARPGKRRQDSVYHAIRFLQNNPLVCIHDSVRPLIDSSIVDQVVAAAEIWDAAAVGVRVRSTIKVCNDAQMIVHTPNRALLWEMQTPQVIRLELLKEGFAYADTHQMTVTDDVSLVELLGKPVKVVEGSYANLKVTTPDDLIFIEKLIEKHAMLQTYTSL
jgi:2-C-methyl-D-erythritol 4-phosphate cytidylyltransferase